MIVSNQHLEELSVLITIIKKARLTMLTTAIMITIITIRVDI